MICLGIDTSGKSVHVAVTREDRVLSRLSSDGHKTHSETLLVTVQAALDEAETALSGIGLIAVGLGPGAWTGLRTGITTARSLSWALSIPIMGIPSLDAIAAGVTDFEGRLTVIIDARRGELYGKNFVVDGGGGVRAEGTVFVTEPQDLDRFTGGDWSLVGNGTALLPDRYREGRIILPDLFGEVNAGALCRLAIERFERKGPDDPRDITPIYVRKSDAEINRDKKEGTGENTC